jgi:hypothetical protein
MMQEFQSETDILDHDVAFSPELVGKECASCSKALRYSHFRADHSYRDGRRDQCLECEAAPRMSTAEHTARLRERNNSSHWVKQQMLPGQEDYECSEARQGHRMHHSEFVRKLRKLVPCLLVIPGNVKGDLAVYRVYPQPQAHLDGMSMQYLWYVPMGWMPEFSIYLFDSRGVPTREEKRGWRTPLLRLIKSGLLTEEKCNEVFGRPPEGAASAVWFRKLHEHRNQTSAE